MEINLFKDIEVLLEYLHHIVELLKGHQQRISDFVGASEWSEGKSNLLTVYREKFAE